MSDIDKRLDEIIKELKEHIDNNCYPIEYCWDNKREPLLKQTIKQLMVDEFEKMIGDMEYRETFDMGLSSWSNEDYKAFGRNELRAELRQKLEEFRK